MAITFKKQLSCVFLFHKRGNYIALFLTLNCDRILLLFAFPLLLVFCKLRNIIARALLRAFSSMFISDFNATLLTVVRNSNFKLIAM